MKKMCYNKFDGIGSLIISLENSFPVYIYIKREIGENFPLCLDKHFPID